MPIDESLAGGLYAVDADGNPVRWDGLQEMSLTMTAQPDDEKAEPFVLQREFSFSARMRPARMNRKRFVKAVMSRGASKKEAKRIARRTKIPYGDAFVRILFYGVNFDGRVL